MTIDLLPTIARLAGTPLPDHTIDGRNIWPLIAGHEGAESPHDAYFFYRSGQLQAVRSGKWKLHFRHSYRGVPDNPPSNGKSRKAPPGKIGLALFNLETDIAEQDNLADDHPAIVQRLTRLAEAKREEIGDRLTKTKGRNTRPLGRVD